MAERDVASPAFGPERVAELRRRYPVLAKIAYLNAGSVGPLSRATHQAVAEWETRGLELGRGRRAIFAEVFPLVERLRAALAGLVGVEPANMVLTTSTTEGCNMVLTGLRLDPDDEVVTTDAEHPGLSAPLAATGAALRVAEVLNQPAGAALDLILGQVTPRTRLIALSHVLWLNGQVLPIEEIRRRTGLPLLVDGAQAVGAIRVDAAVADYYTISGQKWLCGPETTGGLYVADPTSLHPRMAGFAATIAQDAGRLAVTFPTPARSAGLAQALEELPPWAFEAASAAAARCRARLIEEGIKVVTEPGQGTLVSFAVEGEPEQAVARADERGVVLRYVPGGWLRASCGWWTDEQDIERLIKALR